MEVTDVVAYILARFPNAEIGVNRNGELSADLGVDSVGIPLEF
jgi:hypothetical protein